MVVGRTSTGSLIEDYIRNSRSGAPRSSLGSLSAVIEDTGNFLFINFIDLLMSSLTS